MLYEQCKQSAMYIFKGLGIYPKLHKKHDVGWFFLDDFNLAQINDKTCHILTITLIMHLYIYVKQIICIKFNITNTCY